MQSNHEISNPARWTGRVLSIIAILFMLMDAGMKLVCPPFVVQASAQLGVGAAVLRPIGAVLLAFTLLYIIPRTAILGAILLTGFLGGAAAANVLAHTPLFNLAFPLIFAAFVWGGLWLRDVRLRALLPLASGGAKAASAAAASAAPAH